MSLKIILANPRGFCAGVNMAIDCLDKCVAMFGDGIHVFHEIVHNKYVVDRFTQQGVKFVEHVHEVPRGAILVYSAHGVSPEVRAQARARDLRTVDATCPLVTKVHLEAIKYAREGYNIILIGHEGHDEVIGTMGEAPESITLVEDCAGVEKLNFTPDQKLAFLTQTTLSVEEANAVIQGLEQKFPWITHPPKEDICYATTNRQHAVRELMERADLLLVLGSQNSSNSRRLMEIGVAAGKPAHLIDGACELKDEWFENIDAVLITAGASAPEIVVQACLDHLFSRFGATLDEVTTRTESMTFPLPRELRTMQVQLNAVS